MLERRQIRRGRKMERSMVPSLPTQKVSLSLRSILHFEDSSHGGISGAELDPFVGVR